MAFSDTGIEAEEGQAPFQVRGTQAAPSEPRHEMLPGAKNRRERRTSPHRVALRIDARTIVVAAAVFVGVVVYTGLSFGDRRTSRRDSVPSRRGPIGERGHGPHGRHGTIRAADARGGRVASVVGGGEEQRTI